MGRDSRVLKWRSKSEPEERRWSSAYGFGGEGHCKNFRGISEDRFLFATGRRESVSESDLGEVRIQPFVLHGNYVADTERNADHQSDDEESVSDDGIRSVIRGTASSLRNPSQPPTLFPHAKEDVRHPHAVGWRHLQVLPGKPNAVSRRRWSRSPQRIGNGGPHRGLYSEGSS